MLHMKIFWSKWPSPIQTKLNEIFAHTRMTAEKAGDMIEFWLGALDIAAVAWGRPLGECQDPPAQ